MLYTNDGERIKMKEDKIKNIVKGMIYKVKSKFVDQDIIDKFHNIFYDLGTYQFTEWMGLKIYKYPSDLFLYQEIIFKNKPDIIIETGTLYGGSSLFYADILNLMGNGRVITIDNMERNIPEHPRIKQIISDSIDISLIHKLKQQCKSKKVMVILDSDHHKEHVLREMQLYSGLVSKGQYMVVEDGSVGGNPVHKNFGEGPYEAIEEFMSKNRDFKIDKKIENKFLITQNTNGYLKKIK